MNAASICKLQSTVVYGDLLKLTKKVLNSRFQQLLLNGQASGWLPVNPLVPDGH